MKKQAAIFVGILLLILFAAAVGQDSIPSARRAQVPGTASGASIKVNMDFGRVPVYFIPNQGQLDKQVAFYIQGRDKMVYFTPGGVTFSIHRRESATAGLEEKASVKKLPAEEDFPSRSWVVKLDFVRANKNVKPVGEDITGGMISYFKGKPGDWKAGLPTYSRIVYRDLWPGIDLAYSGTTNRLKYEFIVHPGADPSQIRLAYRGVEGISVDDEGRLEVKTAAGAFKDDVPVAYQEIAGVRKDISLSYKLDARGEGDRCAGLEKDATADAHIYAFEVGVYDSTQPLVLDPALFIYAGFIGGSAYEYGVGIAVDGSGNAYVAGYTQSTEATFPETVGPDLTFNGTYDAFVAKVSASGASLVYCGYLGGSEDDRGTGIAVDASGNAYVTGYTLSTETSFPVVAGYDMTHNGLNDAFVAKVNAAGNALVYCTYIGGSAQDYGYGIALDGSDNAYITGDTGSSEATFPVLTGPDLSYNGETRDGFVCKLNSAGNGLHYCGYVGGSGVDHAVAIAVDGSGNAYIIGQTNSTESTFPVAVGPDLTYWANNDAFVAKVNSSGTALAYCGYIGGSADDNGFAIAVDSQGSAYVTGHSMGALPTVVGPDLTKNGGSYVDAFVAKVSPAGDALLYCGYIGGTNVDRGLAIAVDPSGCAYVAGYTQSSPAIGFPVLEGPDLTTAGANGFIAKVNASGSMLVYCGYVGGDANYDSAYGVAVDAWGNAYVTGYTGASNFPTRVGPDLGYNGGYDAFAAKIYYYWAPEPKSAVGDFDGDGTKEAAFDFGAGGAWLYDSGAWAQITTMNPEGMIKANVDGGTTDELFLEFGPSGLWLWKGGVLDLKSGVDVETMAPGDVDGDGQDELAADFGAAGLWLWDAGSWTQLSGANVEFMVVADLDGNGGAEIIGDFGTLGLWSRSGATWTQLSGVNAQYITAATDETGGQDLVGDFGPVGLWLFSSGAWTPLSGVNADYMIGTDLDNDGASELVGDFALTGLWVWDSGNWNILSGVNPEFMIAADTDGDGAKELAVDFCPLGVWLCDGVSWNQISGLNPENLMAGDIDGDNAEEIFADFGTQGLWLWNGGVWSQISAINPD